MNTAPSHLRELSLRQLFAAEAVPAAERQHLEHCGECRARLEGLREEQQQFEAEISFERFAGGVERAARETKQAPSSSQASAWRWSVALAASLVLVVLGARGGLFKISEGRTNRIKSGAEIEAVPNVAVRGRAGDRLPLGVGGSELWRLPHFGDLRGELAPLELGADLPFIPVRSVLVYGVPSDKVRGEHAHKTLHEYLVCLRGSCSVALDDGHSRDEVVLDTPTVGLHIPPRLWRVHYKYSPDAVLLVLCSSTYDANDYIRDYEEFLRVVRNNGN